MSENPGPATPGRQGDEQRTPPPVDTGPGPGAGDVNPGPGATADEREDADELDEG